MLYSPLAASSKVSRSRICWEGYSLDVLRAWPKPIREDFGIALGEMQDGRPVALPVRPMPSIARGVFELKDADESKWYRLVYLARVEGIVYVLHCFTKNTAKTEKRDLATALQRWRQVQQRLREEKKDEKEARQRQQNAPRDTGKRTR